MALILIRGENNLKLLNSIDFIEKNANLTLLTNPKVIDSRFADSLVEEILNSKLKTMSKVATAFFVKEDSAFCIMQIKKIHPPSHIVIVSEKYGAFNKLQKQLNHSQELWGYHPYKARNDGIIDYKIKGEEKYIKNEKLNSYSFR